MKSLIAMFCLIVVATGCQKSQVSSGSREPSSSPENIDSNLELLVYDQTIIREKIEFLNSLFTTSWIDREDLESFLNSVQMALPATQEEKNKKLILQKGLQEIQALDQHKALVSSMIAKGFSQEPARLEAFFDKQRMFSRSFKPNYPLNKEPFDLSVRESVFIQDLERFAFGGDTPTVIVPINNVDYRMTIGLDNRKKNENGNGIPASIRCSESIGVKRAGGKDFQSVTTADFELKPIKKGDESTVELQLPKKQLYCDVFLTNRADPKGAYGFRLVSEEYLFGEKLGINVNETCLYQKDEPATDPLDLFLNIHNPIMTCAAAPEHAELVVDSLEGLSKKVEMLTGSPLPREVMTKPILDYQLDFSKAPKLDSILLSYLEYRSDFAGHLVGQGLLYHAKRGAQVRIMVPALFKSPFVSKRDLAYLHSLMAQSPNIQLQRFWSEYENPDLPQIINRLQRSIHTKIMITLSKSDANANSVLIGGRNIKDTFIFEKTPDYSSRPDWIQYGKDEPYIFFVDSEMYLRGKTVANQIASQLLSFFYRDTRNMRMRQTSAHFKALELTPEQIAEYRNLIKNKTHVRHMLSVPYLDKHDLEDVLAKMLDSARKRVRIVNPYFNPTSKLAKAFRNAAERGVKIELISRLSFVGDNSPTKWVEEVNKKNFNKFFGSMELYNWVGNSILHAKTMSIDDELLYIGGANFNARTMAHDAENGYIVTGPEILKQYNEAYDNYFLRSAEKVTEPLKLRKFYQLVLKLIAPTKAF